LNLRPLGYEPSELPDCSTPHDDASKGRGKLPTLARHRMTTASRGYGARMTIRSAYPTWPTYNQRLVDVVANMTEEQLAVQPAPDRWPIWATIGHAACQRVFWLCDFAAESGAETTPFTNAAFDCPGDDDLDHPLDAPALVEALASTFHIVEHCLDDWTIDMLDEEIRRRWGDEERVHDRGWVLERVFAHDVYHCAELNETLGTVGLPQIDLWS
jgi:DinB superfamily